MVYFHSLFLFFEPHLHKYSFSKIILSYLLPFFLYSLKFDNLPDMPINFILFFMTYVISHLARTIFMPIPVPFCNLLYGHDGIFASDIAFENVELGMGCFFLALQETVKLAYKLLAEIIHLIFFYLNKAKSTCSISSLVSL